MTTKRDGTLASERRLGPPGARRLGALTTLAVLAWAGPAAADTAAFDAAMKPVLASYLKIHDALARDTTDGVVKAARSIASKAGKLGSKKVTGEHAKHYAGLGDKIRNAADALTQAKSIEQSREAFKRLSRPLAMWGSMSKPSGVSVVFCSMAKGSWLQHAGEIRNPYYGESMLRCGEVVGGAPASKMPAPGNAR